MKFKIKSLIIAIFSITSSASFAAVEDRVKITEVTIDAKTAVMTGIVTEDNQTRIQYSELELKRIEWERRIYTDNPEKLIRDVCGNLSMEVHSYNNDEMILAAIGDKLHHVFHVKEISCSK